MPDRIADAVFSATALQSLEIACDTILSGKAKVMLAGGFDDLTEEGSFEFANMKATSNAESEFAMGREPNEFSRPTTTTRAGVSLYYNTYYNTSTLSNFSSQSLWKAKALAFMW
jgi:acetyl-CoA acetyltransferase